MDRAETGEACRGLLLRGRVQGVGFRWWTQALARNLRLRGTVSNLPDGSVEVHVAGPAESVAEFLRHLRSGPRHARVDSVEEVPCRDPLPAEFRIAL